MKDTIVIGVCGGTGSGKTTLAQKIKDSFPNDCILLSHDFYYKAHDDMPFEERVKLNYDHPNAFDTELLIEQIEMLKKGLSIKHPLYDYTIHNRKTETVLVEPKTIIIIEGFMIFENTELLNLMDIKVFVDTDADVRIIRRIMRDVKERDRSLESVVTQYLTTVKPMHEQFVEPNKKKADIIIPEGGFNKVAISVLLEQIRSVLNGNQN